MPPVCVCARLATLNPIRCLLAAIAIAVLSVLQTASAGSKDKPIVINGELTDKDPKDTHRKEGSRAHPHTVALRQGVLYVIDLVSKDFDAYLRLEDAAGKPLAENDDVTGSTNARLFFISPKTGDYIVVATANRPKTGKYRLTVQEAHVPFTPLPLSKDGGTVKGMLTVTGPRSPFSPHSSCQLYRAELKAGTTYQIDLTSADFDAYLTLADASLVQLASDDDSGGKRDARIRFPCKHDGTYYIVAAGLNEPQGSFELKVRPIMSK
jgi:hypothetical protein